MLPTFFNVNYHDHDSASETFVLCLCNKFVVENSLSSLDEPTLDRAELEIELDTESGVCTWLLNIWESERCCSVASGAGFPWASSARRLRRFITVGKTFDEMDSNPGSCEQNMHRQKEIKQCQSWWICASNGVWCVQKSDHNEFWKIEEKNPLYSQCHVETLQLRPFEPKVPYRVDRQQINPRWGEGFCFRIRKM